MPTVDSKPAEQCELWQSDVLPVGLELIETEETQRRRFTAERVARNRERYGAIVEALGKGLPVRMICAAFAVSHHVVKLIREREADLVATEKQRTARALGHLARMVAESYMEDLEAGRVPPATKPVAVGIFLDKKALLEGEATARIEHVRPGLPTLEEVRRQIVEIEATVVSDSPSEGQPLISAANPPLLEIGASCGRVEPGQGAELDGQTEGGGGGQTAGGGSDESMGEAKTEFGQKESP